MNKIWIFLLAIALGSSQIFSSAVVIAGESNLQQTLQENEETIRKLLDEKFEQAYFLARMYEQNRNTKKAVEYYEIAHSIKEQDLETNRKLAELNYELHRYDKALPIYETLLDLESGNKSHVYERLGNCYKKLGNIDKAKETWIKIIEVDPGREYSYSRLGSVYKNNKMYDEAIAIYQKAIELFPDSYQLHMSLGELYGSMKEYELAAAECEKALIKVETNNRRWVTDRLMEYYKKAGMIDELIEAKKSELKKLDRELKSSCLKMAASYEKNREYLKAIKMYEQMLVLDITAEETKTINKKIERLKQKKDRE